MREYFKTIQSTERLDQAYGPEQYYAYHGSPEFREAFLKPLAEQVNKIGGTCLDLGCGEGWLADYVTCNYIGMDASEVAIETALERHPDKDFCVGRLEIFAEMRYGLTSIIFGNILWLLIKPQHYVDFIQAYLDAFQPSHFIIYDLLPLKTAAIAARWERTWVYTMQVDMPDLPPVKRTRKIEVYRCL